jgi:hypothetical protein
MEAITFELRPSQNHLQRLDRTMGIQSEASDSGYHQLLSFNYERYSTPPRLFHALDKSFPPTTIKKDGERGKGTVPDLTPPCSFQWNTKTSNRPGNPAFFKHLTVDGRERGVQGGFTRIHYDDDTCTFDTTHWYVLLQYNWRKYRDDSSYILSRWIDFSTIVHYVFVHGDVIGDRQLSDPDYN